MDEIPVTTLVALLGFAGGAVLGAPLALAAIFLGAYLGLKYMVEGRLRAVFRSGFARY
jgi:hypothetical protein